ncbi:hypothetical protein ACIRLA_25500 [Streptomyces sp. NPDC102364]|uniref:hypothetical protein n=1 Tax=Streptomyces sp. NPDC102364 TaxID=3366161 RepID=UPI0037F2C46C
MSSRSATVGVFSFVEHVLVLGEESLGGADSSLSQTIRVFAHEKLEVLPETQAPVFRSGFGQGLDVGLDARAQLCLRHSWMVTPVTNLVTGSAAMVGWPVPTALLDG